MKNHQISETGVSFGIQFGLWIKIWAGEHIFHIWQQTIALSISLIKSKYDIFVFRSPEPKTNR